MLVQLPDMATGSNTFIMMTAHAGKQYQLDARTPLQKQLTFLKQDVKFKNVPEKFLFLTNNLWYAVGASPMINRTTKAPEYPRNSSDDLSGDTDLMLVTFSNLRAKNGPSGIPFEVIISQSEGYLQALSALHYLKNNDRFGLGGHDRAYFCELRPGFNSLTFKYGEKSQPVFLATVDKSVQDIVAELSYLYPPETFHAYEINSLQVGGKILLHTDQTPTTTSKIWRVPQYHSVHIPCTGRGLYESKRGYGEECEKIWQRRIRNES
jgi:hypothetical protein